MGRGDGESCWEGWVNGERVRKNLGKKWTKGEVCNHYKTVKRKWGRKNERHIREYGGVKERSGSEGGKGMGGRGCDNISVGWLGRGGRGLVDKGMEVYTHEMK